MTGGREAGKVMGPLFPRLHVNDVDKGGPRAPPRNKMALYEQFSIPSQRSDYGPVPSFRFPASSGSGMVSSASVSQEHALHLKHNAPPQLPDSISEEFQSTFLHVKNAQTFRMDLVRSSPSFGSLGVHKDSTQGKSRTGCGSSLNRNFSKAKSSCQKKIDEEDDYSVPTLDKDQSETDRSFHSKSMNMDGAATSGQPRHHSDAHEKYLEQSLVVDLKSKKHERNNEQIADESLRIRKHGKNVASSIGYSEKVAAPTAISIVPSNPEQVTANVNGCEKLGTGSTRPSDASKRVINSAGVGSDKGDASSVRNGSRPIMSINGCKMTIDGRKDIEVPQSQEIEELENNVVIDSGSSMVDSEAGIDISPDDTCRVIGPKNYWKARQVLRNQQRVFAEQLFELHRLIKVQNIIAASPSMLLEGSVCIPSPRPSEVSERSSKHVPKDTLKEDPPKENKIEYKAAPSSRATSEVDFSRGQVDQPPKNAHQSRDLSTTTASVESTNTIPWCFQPPGNQWLIPVMSPSEGLIYKPCMTPYPPNYGFAVPAFGGCAPLPMLPFPGGAFPVPMHHPQPNIGIPANYFMPPHAIPMPSMQNFVNAPSKDQVEEQSLSSGNASNPESDAFSGNNQNLLNDQFMQSAMCRPKDLYKDQASHSTVLQPLPCPAVEASVQSSRAQVIKVVPHNPRTATESAARIFRSIQKERQLHGLE